ncbi:MAG: 6-carboxytetrahydropterin synthase [Desulfurococcales archaeon]|nr:6-carboxytetrahydropterin synthase [Desulfurococcales archaeon]
MVRVKVGVEGLTFDASHYTKGIAEKCMNLHGHTFRVSVEVEGDIDPETGMVVDFSALKKVVKEVISDYDHKIIVPRKDLGKISIEGPFNTGVKVIDYPEATTEYLALSIAKEIKERLGMPVRVKLYEGERNYVVVELT